MAACLTLLHMGRNKSTLTVVGPCWLRSDLAAEGVYGVIGRPWTAAVVAAVWVRQTVRRLFAVCLAQQGVEAVVEAGAEAEVSGVAGAVQRAVVVLLGRRECTLVLVVVGGLMEVVLLEGGK